MKAYVLKVLEASRGDDLHRAQSVFKWYSRDQMNEEYGQSGKTPNQMLDEYRAHEDEVDKAIAWLKGV